MDVEDDPSVAAAQRPQGRDPQPAVVADYDVKTSRIDELENVLSNVVTDHRLAPLSRAGHFDGGFQFHGLRDLGAFNVSFGRELSAQLGPESADDRIGIAMASKGKSRLILGREEIGFPAAMLWSFRRDR